MEFGVEQGDGDLAREVWKLRTLARLGRAQIVPTRNHRSEAPSMRT
jgi:hypothetical protein